MLTAIKAFYIITSASYLRKVLAHFQTPRSNPNDIHSQRTFREKHNNYSYWHMLYNIKIIKRYSRSLRIITNGKQKSSLHKRNNYFFYLANEAFAYHNERR